MTDFEREPTAGPMVPLGDEYLRGTTLLTERERGGTGETNARGALRTARLQAVTAALCEAVTIADVVAVILDHAAAELAATAGVVVAITPRGSEFTALGQFGYPPDALSGPGRVPRDILPALHEALHTSALVIPASMSEYDEHFSPADDLRWPRRTATLVALPLVTRGRAIGAIGLDFAGARDVDADDRAMLLMLAQQCAVALERARLYDAEQAARQVAERAAARTARLQAVTAALVEALTPAQVAAVIVEEGVAALGARAGSLAIVTEDGAALELAGMAGYPQEFREKYRHYPLTAATPMSAAVRTGQAVWIESAGAVGSAFPGLTTLVAGTEDRAWATVPLVLGGRAIGGLGFSFAEERTFSTDDRA